MIFRAFKYIALTALMAVVKKAWAKRAATAAKPARHAQKPLKSVEKGVHAVRPRRKTGSATAHTSR